MLRVLSIANLAIIEQLELELGAGLNVFTGETGAGKSIILDAISLLVGGRADATLVRTGAGQGRVEGVFVLSADAMDQASPVLKESGIETDGDELILAREINAEGRNLCRVNGQIVPSRLLARIGEALVDIHGQGQHLSLFRVREHVDILDSFAGARGLRAEVGALVSDIRKVRLELDALRRDRRDAAQRLDLLSHQVREINQARLRPGEEEELARQRSIAANAERILTLAEQARQALYEGAGAGRSASDALGDALAALGQLEKLDPSLRETREAVESLAYQVDEVSRSLQAYREGVDFDPGRLQSVEERLELIFRLKRKYGGSIQEILSYAAGAGAELERLSKGETRADELQQRQVDLLARLGVAAGRLSSVREEAGGRLARAVEQVLAQLAMRGTRVAVNLGLESSPDGVIVPAEIHASQGPLAFDGTGVDRVEFVMAANPGEALKPLARVASGGEASRLMLAIKVVLAGADRVPTLVFDEIDSGVGGRLGSVIGQKLWDLGRHHQVLCVTHLPHIASLGDRHFRVAKGNTGGRTSVAVESLTGEARTSEIAAMLGSASAAALQNAREMLAEGARWTSARQGAG